MRVWEQCSDRLGVLSGVGAMPQSKAEGSIRRQNARARRGEGVQGIAVRSNEMLITQDTLYTRKNKAGS